MYQIWYERGDYEHYICLVATKEEAQDVCNAMHKRDDLEPWEQFRFSELRPPAVYSVDEAIECCINDRDYYNDYN